ncbi:MAG: hypothetical protein ACPHCJ_10895 [Oceanococcaceae bacterium]
MFTRTRTTLAVVACALPAAAVALSPAEQYQRDQILQGGPSSLRSAAKSITSGGASQELLDILAETLLQNLNQEGKAYVDALAWSCKALGASGNKRYAGVLEAAVQEGGKKLDKHCGRAAADLGPAEGAQYKKGMVNLSQLKGQSASSSPAAPAPKASSASRTGKISDVKEGMSYDEALAIAGAPTSTSSHITGKSFIPFNFKGADTRRTNAHYKGQGRIVFSNPNQYTSDMRVLEVQVDPNESGYP